MDFEDRIDSFDEWLTEEPSAKKRKQSITFKRLLKSPVMAFVIITLGLLAIFPFIELLIEAARGFTLNLFANWWVIFIFFAAFKKLGNAEFTGGMMTLLVAIIFLFNLSWSVMWPVFVLLGLMSSFFDNHLKKC